MRQDCLLGLRVLLRLCEVLRVNCIQLGRIGRPWPSTVPPPKRNGTGQRTVVSFVLRSPGRRLVLAHGSANHFNSWVTTPAIGKHNQILAHLRGSIPNSPRNRPWPTGLVFANNSQRFGSGPGKRCVSVSRRLCILSHVTYPHIERVGRDPTKGVPYATLHP